MLEHGGKLAAAAREHGIPLERWIDLSTGIHPVGYPVPPIPAQCWLRLPEEEDSLINIAAEYYGTPHLRACAGSQAAIQALPYLRPKSRVGILSPTYAEHVHAWKQAGHTVFAIEEYAPEMDLDVLVLANPNNPTGRRFEPQRLLKWHHALAARQGWLVVDEAFIDATPDFSLASAAGMPGLVILRSLGKFFGLAGARVGFVLAWEELLLSLDEKLGPWSIAHPARWVAMQALADWQWQAEQRTWLLTQSQNLAELLTRHRLPPTGGTTLFQWVQTPEAADIHHRLARLGILTRYFPDHSSIRFGLPADARSWAKLDYVLS